jgi:hypothetical protein
VTIETNFRSSYKHLPSSLVKYLIYAFPQIKDNLNVKYNLNVNEVGAAGFFGSE